MVARAKKNLTSLLPGLHTVTVVGISQSNEDPTRFFLELELVEPEPDATRFCVFHAPSKRFTIISATNIHHAGNKATKLYGHEWTGLSREVPKNTSWSFTSVKKFGEFIKKAL